MQGWILDSARLGDLLAHLREGRQLIGPTIREGAIVYEPIEGVDDLPRGWTEEPAPGAYRLKRRDDDAFFGFTVGPQAWKRWLQQPRVTLFRGRAENGNWSLEAAPPEAPPMAFIGVRSCDLHAIAVQDRVLRGGAYVDPHYAARRDNVLLVVVQCAQAASTCFCVSMKTGPRATRGFDLALTEILSPHRFFVEVGSEAGQSVVEALGLDRAEPSMADDAAAVSVRTAAQMGRKLDAENVRELLFRNLDHPRWDEVANRCLSCANCTMVCPTCFCTTVEDTTSLGPEATTERERRWDSRFTLDHSYLHGGSVRSTTRGRYRQWLTHKLASWHDQFGSSGCTGCGRCIAWCPVGIDLTEEVAAIQDSQRSPKK